MTRVTLDPATSRQLVEAGPLVELCDDTGRVIGRFVAAEASTYAGLELPPLTESELDRRRSAPRYTTAEVLDHLEQRRSP